MKDIYKMNLQLFAEEGTDEDTGTTQGEGEDTTEETTEEKALTQEDIQKMRGLRT